MMKIFPQDLNIEHEMSSFLIINRLKSYQALVLMREHKDYEEKYQQQLSKSVTFVEIEILVHLW